MRNLKEKQKMIFSQKKLNSNRHWWAGCNLQGTLDARSISGIADDRLSCWCNL